MNEPSTETPAPETLAEAQQAVSTAPSWLDQDALLREMWLRNEKPSKIAGQLGRSVAAVMTRAARLGLPRRAAPGRKPGYQRRDALKRAAGDLSARTGSSAKKRAGCHVEEQGMRMVRVCLMCLNRFPSEGRHNRICPNCKGSAEYSAGSSIPDPFKDA